MTAVLLGLAYNKKDVSNYWSNPHTGLLDPNQNILSDTELDPLNDSSLLLLSNNCLDCNYKSKRQRLAENRLKEKKNVQTVQLSQRVLPAVEVLGLLSSTLSLSDFNLTAQLGKGSFGTVFAAEFKQAGRSSPRKIALKVIQTSTNNKYKEQLYKSFMSELNAKDLKHSNIVLQFGYNECDLITKNAFIIYELCGTFNLKQFLIDGDRNFSISKRKTMSLDLIKAIEYIHASNIVHMDIKPANIIVTNNLVCKLTDFGCSVKLNRPLLYGNKNEVHPMDLNQYEDNRWTAGTWYYRAPELFRCDKELYNHIEAVTSKCDIYSLAIVMWQLLTRESPYHEYHEDPQVVVYQIVSKKLRPQFPGFDKTDKSKHKSPIVQSKSSSQLSSMLLDSSSVTFGEAKANASTRNQYLSHSRSVTNLKSPTMSDKKTEPDNSEFEGVFRSLIELSWSDDPATRYDAKTLKEILLNTKISY